MFFRFVYEMQKIMTILVESYDYKTQHVFICLCRDDSESRKARPYSECRSLWSFWRLLSLAMFLEDMFAALLTSNADKTGE
jgi:hypothetical protein